MHLRKIKRQQTNKQDAIFGNVPMNIFMFTNDY